MRTYLYTETTVKTSKMYGYRIQLVTVYRVKNNVPTWIGEFEYNTSSNRGHENNVSDWLVDQKIESVKNTNNLYYNSNNKAFRIYGIGL